MSESSASGPSSQHPKSVDYWLGLLDERQANTIGRVEKLEAGVEGLRNEIRAVGHDTANSISRLGDEFRRDLASQTKTLEPLFLDQKLKDQLTRLSEQRKDGRFQRIQEIGIITSIISVLGGAVIVGGNALIKYFINPDRPLQVVTMPHSVEAVTSLPKTNATPTNQTADPK